MTLKHYIVAALAAISLGTGLEASAQTDASSSSSSVVRRRDGGSRRGADNAAGAPQVTDRMQQFFEHTPASDADLAWMRVIYRSLDLMADANTPLYFPEESIDGQENLFRIIMGLLASDRIAAYEYLDGREVFTDQYRVKVKDMLDRFHVYYTEAKGSSEKHPLFTIEESDVPSNEVLSYYIIERWEFDRRNNRMQTRIEAICPVLHRAGDFGGEAVRYPMFWIRFDDLRPYLTTRNIFVSDHNNLPTCTIDDYFQLGMYDGEIYKTRNLRNRSLAQIHPDPEERKHAQDSIQRSLDTFTDNLWVPSLDELAQRREAREAAEAAAAAGAADSAAVAQEGTADEAPAKSNLSTRRTKRGSSDGAKPKAKPAKVKKPKAAKSSPGTATKSVRNRRR